MLTNFSEPERGPEQLSLDQIESKASVEEIVAGFVPPPRFSRVSFENYRPDPTQPSQAAAVSHLRTYVSELSPQDYTRGRFFGRWRRPSQPEGPSGIYIDGGYGVGK